MALVSLASLQSTSVTSFNKIEILVNHCRVNKNLMSIQQTFQTFTDSISGVHGMKSLTVKHLFLPIHKHLMLEL